MENATLRLAIRGMNCASCVARVEKSLLRQPDVAAALVNLVTNEAVITAKPGQNLDRTKLIAAVAKIGYHAALIPPSPPNSAASADAQPPLAWRQVSSPRQAMGLMVALGKNPDLRAGLALMLAAPFLLAMLAEGLGKIFSLPLLMNQALLPNWLQAVLATIILFGLGAGILASAGRALRQATATMDSLVSLGALTAWGYSLAEMWFSPSQMSPHLYFEGVGLLVAFVLLGRALEHRARARAGDAIAALRQLQPLTARVQRPGGEQIFSINQLQVGDIVLVRAGERLPADGVIIEGAAAVDESLVTGESLPVSRQMGDKLVAGSLNLDGLLALRVTALGADSMIAQIIQHVAAAQGSKPIWQKQVDQIAAWFVPAIILLAALCFVGWSWGWGVGVGAGDFDRALAAAMGVLVIACPCALGLATPVAMMVGVGLAARRGILIRDADSLESCRKIDFLLFDKTGTLTMGKPMVTDFFSLAFATTQDQTVLTAEIFLIQALQQGSIHPLADSVRRYAEGIGRAADPLIITEVKTIAGCGVTAVINGKKYGFGNLRLFADDPDLASLASAPKLAEWQREKMAAGETVSFLASLEENPRWLGGMSFADTLRPNAAAAVARLHQMGIKTMIVSGDNPAATQRIAAQLGIDAYEGNLTPAGKLEIILRLRQTGKILAMVGDGINDAPALAAADLGLAMGGGTDIAIKAAALVLMRTDPGLVPEALILARRIHGKIRQGLAWAFAYNIIGIPVAAMGALSPQMAAAAMAVSSIAVVVNALSLRWGRGGW
ncbi:MAG: heavy metal translocating P-type ATPase [Candidatus Symbiobacter sp.]|nr:heavy metal translocating P-type ATPase [Candidatus Symbiobacter sp.]